MKLESTKIGTPMYRPPEFCSMQMQGEIYTQAVDLWGLGCIMYALLVGSDPFPENR